MTQSGHLQHSDAGPIALEHSGPVADLAVALLPQVEAELDRAAAATDADRRLIADDLNAQFSALRPAGGRAQADALLKLLEGGRLTELVDSEGKTCRAAAAEALIAMGYPYALELSPEDLDHVRKGGGFRSHAASLVSALTLIAVLTGLEVVLGASSSSGTLSFAHAALTGLSAIAMAVTRPRTRARKYALWAVILSGLEGVGLAILGAPGALLAGLGALVAAALMSKTSDPVSPLQPATPALHPKT
jgi:hypothetical protein